jgi:hypothetical protein
MVENTLNGWEKSPKYLVEKMLIILVLVTKNPYLYATNNFESLKPKACQTQKK